MIAEALEEYHRRRAQVAFWSPLVWHYQGHLDALCLPATVRPFPPSQPTHHLSCLGIECVDAAFVVERYGRRARDAAVQPGSCFEEGFVRFLCGREEDR